MTEPPFGKCYRLGCQRADEIDRLTRENWQLKQALGYPIPAEFDTPRNPFKCGSCDARKTQKSN